MWTALLCSQPQGWVSLTSKYQASSAVLSKQGTGLAFMSAAAAVRMRVSALICRMR